jgi:predicted RNA-binding Zn-ribbon protein involved in translation (DUF1610 family)
MPTDAMPTTEAVPTPRAQSVVCPYCGTIETGAGRCSRCGGRFDPLSRQASQNAMGPWFVLDRGGISRPGCSYEVIRTMVARGQVTGESVVRGPSTRQFWALAKHTPGVAHLLGRCHNCAAECSGANYACPSCGAAFEVDRDRQHLGLGPVRAIPGVGAGASGSGPMGGSGATGVPRVVRSPASRMADGPDLGSGGGPSLGPGAGAKTASGLAAHAVPADAAWPDAGDGAQGGVPEAGNRVFRPRRSAWPAVLAAGACLVMAAVFAVYVAVSARGAGRGPGSSSTAVSGVRSSATGSAGGQVAGPASPEAVPLAPEPITPAQATVQAARAALASEDLEEIAAAIAAVEALSPRPPEGEVVLEALRDRLDFLVMRSAQPLVPSEQIGPTDVPSEP